MDTSSRPKLHWRDALSEWAQSWVLPGLRRASEQQNQESHDETYDAKYYEFIEFSATWSREAMANSIVRDLAPRHVLDLGCGTGALLEAFRARNIQVTGLEYSDVAIKDCIARGLPVYKFDITRDQLPTIFRQCDLSVSFEVAEHLPARLANRFVKLLSSAGDAVVMSAATPGQGGTNHFNEQPHEYWIRKMARRGFNMDRDLSLSWRAEWRGKTAKWYHANVMVFRRPGKAA